MEGVGPFASVGPGRLPDHRCHGSPFSCPLGIESIRQMIPHEPMGFVGHEVPRNSGDNSVTFSVPTQDVCDTNRGEN